MRFITALAILLFASNALAANVMTPATYSFTIVKDTTAPVITDQQPAPGASNVDPIATITFHVKDAELGVNQSSIVLKVNNTVVPTVVTGTKYDYTVSYVPVTPFTYGQTVNVSISASDLAP